jgi:hypothetical protein
MVYTDPKITALCFAAVKILQKNSIYFSWTELEMVAEFLSSVEPALDSGALAEFYMARA